MGTFGSGVFGGGGGSGGGGSVGVPLASIVQRAYRIAGITKWVGTTPQDDWFTEAIAELNAFIGTLNLNRLNIFTVAVTNTPLSSGIKAYLVGSGATPQTIAGVDYGAFDMPRPQRIENGVVLLGPADNQNVVRMPPMYQMNDAEWALISLQNVRNGIPLSFYYDGSYDPETGFGIIYLWPQTDNNYSVDWFTWQSVPKFISKDDTVALPDGYEDVFVYCLAERLANLNPHQSKMLPESRLQAARCRAALQKYNAPIPKPFENDAANVGNTSPGQSGHWDYRVGFSRPSGGW